MDGVGVAVGYEQFHATTVSPKSLRGEEAFIYLLTGSGNERISLASSTLLSVGSRQVKSYLRHSRATHSCADCLMRHARDSGRIRCGALPSGLNDLLGAS